MRKKRTGLPFKDLLPAVKGIIGFPTSISAVRLEDDKGISAAVPIKCRLEGITIHVGHVVDGPESSMAVTRYREGNPTALLTVPIMEGKNEIGEMLSAEPGDLYTFRSSDGELEDVAICFLLVPIDTMLEY